MNKVIEAIAQAQAVISDWNVWYGQHGGGLPLPPAGIPRALDLLAEARSLLAAPAPLPDRDTSKPASKQGLFRKFIVMRTDGSHEPGGRHEHCESFVLDVNCDPHAAAALAAYADSVQATHPALASDMRARYALAAPAPQPDPTPLWALIYGAMVHGDRAPKTPAEFEQAAKTVAGMIERRAAIQAPSAEAPSNGRRVEIEQVAKAIVLAAAECRSGTITFKERDERVAKCVDILAAATPAPARSAMPGDLWILALMPDAIPAQYDGELIGFARAVEQHVQSRSPVATGSITVPRWMLRDALDGNVSAMADAADALRDMLDKGAAAPQAPVVGEPIGWESRFSNEREWTKCSKEHHDMVVESPQEWPGYEVRGVYAAPQATHQPGLQLAQAGGTAPEMADVPRRQPDICDTHCTWLDHAPGCERAEVSADRIRLAMDELFRKIPGESWESCVARMISAADRALRSPGMAHASAWQPIETAPTEGREMFVVKGFNVTADSIGARNYTTDPYCVWPRDGGGLERWPHPFPPTHWMPLPAAPDSSVQVTGSQP